MSDVHFMICNSCFWCASVLADRRLDKCPCCNCKDFLESMPLVPDESYKFSYSAAKGVALEFA
jgi:hypothetical protein